MIILNEKEYAEKCIKENHIDKKPFKTLSILAKYYYHHCGYKPKKIKSLLVEFLAKNYDLYNVNRASWDLTIDKITKNVRKYKLYEIDGVWITKAELETIESIGNKVLERVAFTLLCLAKLSILKNENNPGWVNNDASEVFALANAKCKAEEMYMKLNKLVVKGLLGTATRIDNLSLKVKYINDNSEKVLFINDFRELGLEYLYYKGEDYVRCKECGLLIKNNKNKTKKYCKDCAGYIPQRTKTVVCVDCDKEFEVDASNKRTNRCEACYSEYRRKYYAENKRKQRKL